MICNVYDLGLIDYQRAWDLQGRLAEEIAGGVRPPTLLLLEHPHTYTFGRKGQATNLLWDEKTLNERHISVYWVDRGGDVTYHGPGQLIGYPLIPLGKIDENRDPVAVDYVGYVRKLEQTLIYALAHLGLPSGQIPGMTGVWVQPDIASRCPRCLPKDRKKPAKIAAIGVKVDSNGITRHGFALNVAPEMSYFDGIIPCGISDHPVVSLEDLMEDPPDITEVKWQVIRAFGEMFGYQLTQTAI